jgi:hypothetical protein
MLYYLRLLGLLSLLIQPSIAINQSSTEQAASADEATEFQEDKTSLNTDSAQLQWVDKVTGKFQSIYVKVGKPLTYQHLKINVSICRKSAPFEPPDAKAYMTIWEYPKEELPRKLFSGWMFASSPALSTLVNHPRYNLWLIKCTNKADIKEK